MQNYPILYSFRRCPYAMRARLGLFAANIRFEWREILLRDKPPAFLQISDDATVPVLQIGEDIIQESLDIMLWSLAQNDPFEMLERYDETIVSENDGAFKTALDQYKYASRFEDGRGDAARDEAMPFLFALDQKLEGQAYLHGTKQGATDIAVLPFVRQFAHVDLDWFQQQKWPNVSRWLEAFKSSEEFSAIMVKIPQWQEGNAPLLYGQIDP